MDNREFDIILYGASGYTASYVIKELEKISLNIAISARDISKIKETMLPKIECTLEDIVELTKRAKVLINCIGPYTLTGEKIIQACIDTETNYVDICGETLFIDDIYKKYHTIAKDKGIRIIQSCGFDSVPADIGVFLIGKMHDIKEVDCCHIIENFKINVTTWHSLLISFRNSIKKKSSGKTEDTNGTVVKGCVNGVHEGDINKDDPVKRHTNKEEVNTKANFNKEESNSKEILHKIKGEKKKAKTPEYRYNKGLQSYDIKFRGTDPYILKRSCDYFKRKLISDIRFTCFMNIGNVFSLMLYFFFGLMCSILVKFDFFYNLMLKLPGFFTCGHVVKNPSPKDTEKSRFTVLIRGRSTKGAGDRILKISGVDPGYRSTSIFLTQSAITLIEEIYNVPTGVSTPAVAFYKTKIVDRLISKGIKFEYSNN